MICSDAVDSGLSAVINKQLSHSGLSAVINEQVSHSGLSSVIVKQLSHSVPVRDAVDSGLAAVINKQHSHSVESKNLTKNLKTNTVHGERKIQTGSQGQEDSAT